MTGKHAPSLQFIAMKDFYEILGVSKTATDAEIKTAYRKQALQWHPDRNKTPEAADKFKQINKAYEVLADPNKRKMYDQHGPDMFERASAGGQQNYQQGPFNYSYTNFNDFDPSDFGNFSDPFEIFEQFFGFRSPFGGNQKRRAAYSIHLSFDEAVKGTEKDVRIGQETKKIKIPAGVDSGTHIRFSDFDLVVDVAPDKRFKRDGQDLYVEEEISFPQAALGDIVEVPTIDQPVKLKVRPGTQSGTTVRLRSQGVVYPNTSRRGDQYVIFKVKVPEKLSHKAKKLLEQLRDDLG